MKIVIALGLSKKNNAAILEDIGLYVAQMGSSDFYSDQASTDQILATKTSGDNLRGAMNTPYSESKHANVRVFRIASDYQLNKLRDIVSNKANDPTLSDEKRIEIAAASGIRYSIRGGRSKQTFTVTPGTVSSSVHITVPGGAKSNLICYTKDIVTFKERSEPIDTTTSKLDILDLDKDTKYAFFYKPVYPKTKSDWIGPIIRMVV